MIYINILVFQQLIYRSECYLLFSENYAQNFGEGPKLTKLMIYFHSTGIFERTKQAIRLLDGVLTQIIPRFVFIYFLRKQLGHFLRSNYIQ